MKALILIFFGGGVGSLLRYGLGRWINNTIISEFPYGTFVVNLAGCFLIGFIMFSTELDKEHVQQWRLLLATGLCGGFTTFSSFSIENVQLINDGRAMTALLYVFASVCMGLLATYLGLLAGKAI
jgi:CrcB protein